MTNVLTFIAIQYPNFAERSKIKELNLASQGLTGELDFTNLGFNNLTRLEVQNNKLTKLVLNNPNQINYLDISNNQISDFRVPNGLVEDEIIADYFDFINNPLPDEFKKNLLKTRWEYWKKLEEHHSDLLVPRIMELVESSDLDNLINNYDYSRMSADLSQLVGNSELNEYSLQHLSQLLLARTLIIQNELINGVDEKYATEINQLAKGFQNLNSFYIQYPLPLIQRELNRRLRGSKDLEKEFQSQLSELEKLLNPQESLPAPNLQAIKNQINQLQTTIQEQAEDLNELKKAYQQQVLNQQINQEKLRIGEQEKGDLEKINAELTAKLEQLQKELEQKEQELFQSLEINEKARIKLEEMGVKLESSNSSLKNDYQNLIKNKDIYINQLEEALEQLKKNKQAVEDSLRESNQIIENMLKEKDKKGINWIFWGIMAGIIGILGILWWIWRKFF